ncbi:calcium-binding protein [Methylobacterium trifolii]|uniref:Calcium-binding protein n=1 Tax=Methylobacterium trifolii TaxID=1003092 RepID=A0ABQ4TZV1_9HYPH|nr:calcium-binding protein [Methylobacterium trifolii]GJE59120.1 hypothetical protein MPOCJGCO_1207 [Methylobacterium trifolii]
MSYDSEPANNSISTPDIDVRLSSDGLDGQYGTFLPFYDVQSGPGKISRSTGPGAATDPVDYIGFSLNPNVGVVDVMPRFGLTEGPAFNRGGVAGVVSQYNFTPQGAFSGASISLQLRVGYGMYGDESSSLLNEIAQIALAMAQEAQDKASRGIVDLPLANDIVAATQVNEIFVRLFESNGQDVSDQGADRIASDINNALRGAGGTPRFAQVRTDAARLIQISQDWHTEHYFRAYGSSSFSEISSLDVIGTRATWFTTSTESGAPRTGIMEVTGAMALARFDNTANGGSYTFEPIEVFSTYVAARRAGAGLIQNGTAGDDRLGGTEFADTILGLMGNDTIQSGGGDDVVYGNQGEDILFGNQGADTLFGGQGADTAYGGQGNDYVLGNLGNDILLGNLGEDILYGGQGNDTLYGGQGNDVLSGDLGDDVLSGDLGADRYVFGLNSGRDLILGFSLVQGDRIDLQGQGYTLSSTGTNNTLLTLSGGGTVELAGITQGQINASYFS